MTVPAGERAAGSAAGWLALAGFLLLILLPPDILVAHDFPYNKPFGSPLTKLHPSTYLFLASFVAWLRRGNPIGRVIGLARRKPAIAAYGAALTVLIVEQLLAQGSSGTAFIVDTLLVPWFLVVALDDSSVALRRTFFHVAIAILFVNALVAIGESLTGSRIVELFGVHKPELWSEFRASAWLDHPLSNALATSTGLFAAFVMRDRPILLGIIVATFAMSLLSFGGRAAFAVTLAAGAICMCAAMGRALMDGPPRYRTVLLWGIVLMLLPIAAIIAIGGLDLGDRLFSAWKWDDSADSRLLAFRVFDVVSLRELLFGLSPTEIQGLVDNYLSFYTTLTIIENVWIVWMLQFGLILFAIVTASLFAMVWSQIRGAPWPIWMAAIVFLIVGSGNNSLAAKTFLLSMLMVLLIGGRAYAELAGRRAVAPSKRVAADPVRSAPAAIPPRVSMLTGPRERASLLRPPPPIRG